MTRSQVTRRNSSGCAKAVGSLVMSATSWLLTAWYLMLLVGIVHRDWLPKLPTISYGLALLIALLFNWIMDSAAARARFDAKQSER